MTRETKSRWLAFSALAALLILFNNCSKSDSGGSSDEAPAPTPQKVDAWNAPVGEPISGATLREGWTDLRYAAAPVWVSGGWTDSASVSADGLSLSFGYMRYGFYELVDLGQTTVTGPARPGMSGNHMKNFRAELTKDGWSVSYLPFNGDPNQHEGSINFNQAQNIAAFSRFDSSNKASIYFSAKNSDGSWTTAQALPSPVNIGNCSNDNAYALGDLTTGVDLYFESDRTDLACTSGGGKKHIYHTFYNPTNDTYSPVTLVSGVNGSAPSDEDHQPFITLDKKTFYWTAVRSTAYGVFTADWNGSTFANARAIIEPHYLPPYTGNLVFIGEPTVVETSKGQLMYLICGVGTNETGQTHGATLRVCVARRPK